MISGIAQSNSFGFDNLMLQGWKDQRQAAGKVLRDGEGAGQKSGTLSTGQQSQVDKLKATDRRVRAHEQAHMAAGGELVQGGAAYSYETGPDKQRYAVADEVSIDISKARTPEETISKAERIRQAALAPVDPSPQDRRVAAYAAQLEIQARQELAQKAAEERARAGSERVSQVIGAYQTAGGLERSVGFGAEA
jgi:hypothetical protein